MKTKHWFMAIFLAALVLGASFALAQLVPCTGDDCDFKKLAELFKNVGGYFVTIGTLAAAGIIAWAGIVMVSKPADEAKRKQAKEIIWAAVVGLVFLLGALLIVNAILKSLTDKTLEDRLQEELLTS